MSSQAEQRLAIATATATTEAGPSHAAAKAINGDMLSYWDTGPDPALPVTLTLTLAEPSFVSELSLVWRQPGANPRALTVASCREGRWLQVAALADSRQEQVQLRVVLDWRAQAVGQLRVQLSQLWGPRLQCLSVELTGTPLEHSGPPPPPVLPEPAEPEPVLPVSALLDELDWSVCREWLVTWDDGVAWRRSARFEDRCDKGVDKGHKLVGTIVRGEDGLVYINNRNKGKTFLPMATSGGQLLVALSAQQEAHLYDSSSSDEHEEPQAAPAGSVWREYDADGRPYFHNTLTGQTVWTLPAGHTATIAPVRQPAQPETVPKPKRHPTRFKSASEIWQPFKAAADRAAASMMKPKQRPQTAAEAQALCQLQLRCEEAWNTVADLQAQNRHLKELVRQGMQRPPFCHKAVQLYDVELEPDVLSPVRDPDTQALVLRNSELAARLQQSFMLQAEHDEQLEQAQAAAVHAQAEAEAVSIELEAQLEAVAAMEEELASEVRETEASNKAMHGAEADRVRLEKELELVRQAADEATGEAERYRRMMDELKKETGKLQERCIKAEKREAELALALKVEIDRRIRKHNSSTHQP